MKTTTRLLPLLLLAVSLQAAPEPASPAGGPAAQALVADVGLEKIMVAVRAADDERVAATMAADPARLAAIFSEDLHYAHSSGKVDTKASYVASLVSRDTIYASFDYKQRTFRPVGPGIVLMTGRVIIHASNAGQKVVNDLNYLAVWREEGGRWRFLAWQSCKNPPAAPAVKP